MKVIMGRCFWWRRRNKVDITKGKRYGYSDSTVTLLPATVELLGNDDHSSGASTQEKLSTPKTWTRRKFWRSPFFNGSSTSRRRLPRWKLRFCYAADKNSSGGTTTPAQQDMTQNSTRICSISRLENKFQPSDCLKPTMSSLEMDPKIWNMLPEELLDRILSFISLKTLINLRSTCKRFDSLFLSPSFISNYNSSPQHFFSLLLLAHPHLGPNRFAIYDSLHHQWRNFPLPISALLPRSTSLVDSRRSGSSTLITSSKGILCFSRPSSFLVCNLLTRSTRVIKFPNYPFPIDSLTLIPTRSSGYQIFAICRGISSRSTFVYNSDLCHWHQGDGITPSIRTNSRREGVVHGGSLYFCTVEPYSIVRYDLEQRRWDGALSIDEVLPDGCSGQLSFMRLVGDGEQKLYLISGVAAAQSVLTGVKIWELNEGRNWVELVNLPMEMCRKFVAVCYHNYEHVYCMWHGGMIFLCCYTWPQILWYDVSAGEWGWLPKCPLLPQKGNCGFTWFSIVPQLYTLV